MVGDREQRATFVLVDVDISLHTMCKGRLLFACALLTFRT